uniref:Phage tail collar domain-containing protein n=1 Tax=viral metagenome TaxID=1070528 RepID=A0A6C0HV22_9ZZZZ
MEFLHIIVLLLVFVNLYLVYKTRNLEKLSAELPTVESFEVSLADAINSKYTGDIDAIRNLASLANNILTSNDSFSMPANTTYVKDFVVEGSINFTNRNSLLVNILPKFMVIAWANRIVPLGWAICDGKRYSLNPEGIAIENIIGDLTPDLRGRFILGVGIGKDKQNNDMTERKYGDMGGEEGVALIEAELPAHSHRMDWRFIGCYGEECLGPGNYTSVDASSGDKRAWNDYSSPKQWPQYSEKTGGVLKDKTGTKFEGADQDYPDAAVWTTTPHNNMPPFVVLTYIMKL